MIDQDNAEKSDDRKLPLVSVVIPVYQVEIYEKYPRKSSFERGFFSEEGE